jgi:hypothetical protein
LTLLRSITRSAHVWEELEKAGVPEIRGVWSHEPGRRQFTVISPMIHPDSKVLMNSRAVIDACRPYKWMNRFPEVAETSPELRKKVLGKYGRSFFGLC